MCVVTKLTSDNRGEIHQTLMFKMIYFTVTYITTKKYYLSMINCYSIKLLGYSLQLFNWQMSNVKC